MDLKSFKSLFIVDDEQVSQGQNKPTENTTPVSNNQTGDQNWNLNPKPASVTVQTASSTQNQGTLTNPTPSVSDNMVDKLFEFLLQHNLPGPDYLELKNNVSSVSKYINDPSQQFCAAFDVLKGQYSGVTKENILTAIDKYIKMLEDERKRGLDECKKTLNEQDTTSQLRAEEMRATEIDRQMTELKNEFERRSKELKAEQDNVNTLINQLKEKNQAVLNTYNNNCASFNASVDFVVNVLKQDKEKITQLNF